MSRDSELAAGWAALKDASLEDKKRWLHRQAHYELAMAGGHDMYYVDPNYTGTRPYILPFGREYGKWSAYDVEHHPFGRMWLAEMHALVCKRTDVPRQNPSRIIFSSGQPLSHDDRIGSQFTARHDQTGAKLGEY